MDGRLLCEIECHRRGVIFRPHSKSQPHTNMAAWANMTGRGDFSKHAWMTQNPYIYHPDGLRDVMEFWQVIHHELVHWDQQQEAASKFLWAIRYGVSQEYRWLMEREACLQDIKWGRLTPWQCADMLGRFHGITSIPVPVMAAWFVEHAHGC